MLLERPLAVPCPSREIGGVTDPPPVQSLPWLGSREPAATRCHSNQQANPRKCQALDRRAPRRGSIVPAGDAGSNDPAASPGADRYSPLRTQRRPPRAAVHGTRPSVDRGCPTGCIAPPHASAIDG